MASIDTPEAPAAEPAPETKSERGSLARFFVVLVLLAWALRSFVVAPFYIPSSSMLPTLFVGDYVMVAKWPYGYSRYSFPWGFPSFSGRLIDTLPKRGDVVVFRHPNTDEDLIKRVIGVPGDTVELRGGELRQQPLQSRAGRAARHRSRKRRPGLPLRCLSRDAARRAKLRHPQPARWRTRR